MSHSDLVVAVDIGTESSRACIIDMEGKILASERLEQSMSSPKKGWAEQEPGAWWDNTRKNIEKLLNRPDFASAAVKGIGVCGQMHAPVPVDHDGKLISGPVSLWCDKRQRELSGRLASEEPEDGFYLDTVGNPPLPAWFGIKIAWLKENRPEIYKKASHFLPPKDYINYELTGNMATDFSEASGSFLMDKSTNNWSADMIDLLDLDGDKLPTIRPADSILGTVKDTVARQLGLPPKVPVIVGGGDMLCLLLGAGIVKQKLACDTTGTASVFSSFSEKPTQDSNVMSLRHVVEGWINFGILDSGGGSLWWFRDMLNEALPKNGSINYKNLSRAARESSPGAKGLYFLPYLQGERVLGSSRSSGVFFGLTPAHTHNDLARAIMEGVTFDLNQTKVILDESIDIEEMRTIGGGAKSDIWNKIKANIYGIPLKTLKSFEGGVMGCSFLTHSALGWTNDPVEDVEQLEEKRTFKPEQSLVEKYGDYFERFKDLHDRIQPLYEEI